MQCSPILLEQRCLAMWEADKNDWYLWQILHTTPTLSEQLNHILIEGGDNKYCSIAAASILAKVERDKYIEELCKENPELIEKYGIDQNKGYGAKRHLDGIREHGITIWHRRSFGICKLHSYTF